MLDKEESPKLFPGVVSNRLYLSDIKPVDLEDIYRWKNNFDLNDLVIAMPLPVSFFSVQKWLEDNQKDRNQVLFGVFYKDNDKCIGIARIMFINWISQTADFGVYIGEPKYRGKGLGVEIVKTILRYSFKSLNLRKISLRVLESNIAAIKCYESCGFTREGLLMNHYWINGRYENLLILSIFRGNF